MCSLSFLKDKNRQKQQNCHRENSLTMKYQTFNITHTHSPPRARTHSPSRACTHSPSHTHALARTHSHSRTHSLSSKWSANIPACVWFPFHLRHTLIDQFAGRYICYQLALFCFACANVMEIHFITPYTVCFA